MVVAVASRWQTCGLLVAIAATVGCSLVRDFEGLRPGSATDAGREADSAFDAADGGSLRLVLSVESQRLYPSSDVVIPFELQRTDLAAAPTVVVTSTVEGLTAQVSVNDAHSGGEIELSVAASYVPGSRTLTVTATQGSLQAEAPLELLLSGPSGTLDTSFQPSAMGYWQRATDVAVGSGGRVYAVVEGGKTDILAFEQDGSLAVDFADNGVLSFAEAPGGTFVPVAIAADDMGGLLVAGNRGVSAELYQFDSAGDPGTASPLAMRSNLVLSSMTVDAAGRAWMVGSDTMVGNACLWVLDGGVDSAACDVNGAEWTDVALAPMLGGDPRVTVVGTSVTHPLRARRYTLTAGSLVTDVTFDSEGNNVFEVSAEGAARAVAPQQSGAPIVVAVAITKSSGQLVSVIADGTGHTTTDITAVPPQDLDYDNAGWLLIAGAWCADGEGDPTCATVARRQGDTEDESFGVKGRYQLDSPTEPSLFRAVARQPDGRIIAAGEDGGAWLVQRIWD